MIKYYMRLAQGTTNGILDDAFNCVMNINSKWYQTVTEHLKSSGFAYLLLNPEGESKFAFLRKY